MDVVDPQSPRPSVLLVEDDIELARLLVELLEDEGYDVRHVRDGHRGLHLALTRVFDVMVIDRALPEIESSTWSPGYAAAACRVGEDPVGVPGVRLDHGRLPVVGEDGLAVRHRDRIDVNVDDHRP
jgi:CheY-like chemotaxis protein